MNKIELPENYTPIKNIDFCSNRLIQVKVPISFESTPIILLGSGDLPRIWLSAPTKPSGKLWAYVVEDNRPLNPAVTVESNEREQLVLVKVSNHRVLQAKMVGPDSILVDFVDLNPIGLNVKGSSGGLSIGGTTLTNNTFENVYVAFAIGSGK